MRFRLRRTVIFAICSLIFGSFLFTNIKFQIRDVQQEIIKDENEVLEDTILIQKIKLWKQQHEGGLVEIREQNIAEEKSSRDQHSSQENNLKDDVKENVEKSKMEEIETSKTYKASETIIEPKVKAEQQTTITIQKSLIQDQMFMLHERIRNEISEEQIIEFYNRERISESRFGKPLDIEKDRHLLSTLFPSQRGELNDRVTDQIRLKLNIKENKTILIWYGDSSHNQHKLFQDDCNIKACRVTHDKAKVHEADTVFYMGTTSLRKRPPNAKPNQVWVAFQIEASKNYPTITRGLVLNWTATYRRDSVLNTPYERFTPLLNVTDLPSKPLKNYAFGKTKLAAWFVSNCGSQNGRSSYVKELQRHIQVDIYGGCGPFKCVRTSKDCFKRLKNEYKFYIAFENSNCKDYVTEKLFWNGYLNDIVPIVMGAHPDDYRHNAPPRSYIHVDSFQSPKELAEYLKYLDKHDDLYNSYFLWKGTGEFINTKFMCRLCAMTHLAPHFPMWYKDANKWWMNGDICTPLDRTRGYCTWKGRNESLATSNEQIVHGFQRT